MSSSSDEDIYEVDKIVGRRKYGKEEEYLVRWKGYSSRHNSWEPASNLTGCQEIIKKFNEGNQRRQSSRPRKAPSKDVHTSPFKRSRHSSRRTVLKRSQNGNRLSQRSASRLLKQATAATKVLQLQKMTSSVGKLSSFSSPRFSPSIKEKKENYSSTPVSATTSLSNSVKISATNKLSNHQNSDLPQKIFTVTGNRRNVKQWLNLRVPVSKPRSLELIGDHDYMSRSSEAFRRIIPKQPINFQPPETSQLSVTSAARKSTLRKGRVYQERLVLLQWRQNFVEIIFANTSRKNGLTPRFLTELSNALDAVAASKCSVVVVNTVGNTFCSGLDVHYLVEVLSSSKNVSNTAKYLAESVRNFVDKLIEFQRLLIAVVQGPAINLGCTMLALFDIVYCSDKAWFWTPYVEMAQTPESCASVLFPEIFGPITANNMLLNCGKITASEAKLRGFVTEVFPHDSLKRNTMVLIEECAKRSTEAIQISKSLIRSGSIHKLKHVNYCECNELADRWASQDFLDSLLRFVTASEL